MWGRVFNFSGNEMQGFPRMVSSLELFPPLNIFLSTIHLIWTNLWKIKLPDNIVQKYSAVTHLWHPNHQNFVDYQIFLNKISAVSFFMFTFCWENKFLIVQSTIFSQLKLLYRSWKTVNKICILLTSSNNKISEFRIPNILFTCLIKQ